LRQHRDDVVGTIRQGIEVAGGKIRGAREGEAQG
jgi:hypothetical protein